MLTSKQRAFLRKIARPTDPVFQIGKAGITDETVTAVNNALAARELIKLKVLETCPVSAKEAAAILAQATKSDSVQVIGFKFVLFKQKAKESKFDLKHLELL